MKGLSVLFTLVLLAAAHLLAVHLRRARALPAQHPFQAVPAGAASALRTARNLTPPGTVLEL